MRTHYFYSLQEISTNKTMFIPSIGTKNHQQRIAWVIKQLETLPKGARVLDAGAGTQQFRKYAKHLAYVAQDFAAYIPSDAESGLQNDKWDYGELDIISDITKIPEEDGSFDAILCSEVLEHLPHPNLALKEFSRLLKKDGILLITAPFCSLTHQAPYFFATGFSQFYYNGILLENNFSSIELEANGSFFQYLAQEARRLNSVSKTYTNKGLNWYQKIVTGLFLRVLNRQEKKDKGSNELLAFGYFVKAIKN